MAEIVEYRLGKTLEEIDVLIKFGLLNDAQAKEIVKKREEFEYALRRRNEDKLRYLKFIKFEMNLLTSIEQYQKTIAKKTGDEDADIFKLQAKKLGEIVKSRVGHISFLYRKLVMKHQFDRRLWVAYIEFAKQRKLYRRVTALYWRLLRVVNNDESLWLEAANFEIDTTNDLNTARKLLVLGLRHIPDSRMIKDKLKTICDIPSLGDDQAIGGDECTATEAVAAIEGDSRGEAIAHKSKLDMLYECYDAKDIDETRKLYSLLDSSIKNQSLSLYVGMIQVETWQLSKDKSSAQLNRIRAIYEKALQKFGKHKAKLWYEYLQFEHQYASSLEDFDRINRIYTRAQATLKSSEINRVVERYTLMQTKSRGKSLHVEYSDYSDLEE